MHSGFKDLTGRVFGELRVISYNPIKKISPGGQKFTTWFCKCSCGNACDYTGNTLKSGRTTRCQSCYKVSKIQQATPYKQMYTRYKRVAKERNFDFNLSQEQFNPLLKQDCHYCGAPPFERKAVTPSHKGFKANGIDRLNSDLGYVLDNVVSCCKLCNQAKNDLTVTEFKNLISKIHQRFNLI